MPTSRNAREVADLRSFPPEVVVSVKALACELPSRLGRPWSRLHVPDISAEVVSRGIAAEISGTTIWRWLSEDAIRPWRSRSWIFPRDRAFETKATRVLDLYWCHLAAAQSTADSLGLDLHKWGYMPFEVACVLVRHSSAQTHTFGQASAYLTATNRGVANGVTSFADRGLQLSRGFRALKVWMSLKEYGSDRIGRIIQQNLEQAAHLAAMVDTHPDLERLAPVELNIVCFRFAPADTEPAGLDAVNREILFRVQEGGQAVPSHTILGGRFALRVYHEPPHHGTRSRRPRI